MNDLQFIKLTINYSGRHIDDLEIINENLEQFKRRKFGRDISDLIDELKHGQTPTTSFTHGFVKLEGFTKDGQAMPVRQRSQVKHSVLMEYISDLPIKTNKYYKESIESRDSAQTWLDNAENRFKAHLANPPSFIEKIFNNGSEVFSEKSNRLVKDIDECKKSLLRCESYLQDRLREYEESLIVDSSDSGKAKNLILRTAKESGVISQDEMHNIIASFGGKQDPENAKFKYQYKFIMKDSSTISVSRESLALFAYNRS